MFLNNFTRTLTNLFDIKSTEIKKIVIYSIWKLGYYVDQWLTFSELSCSKFNIIRSINFAKPFYLLTDTQ